MSRMRYDVEVYRDGRWWMVEIPAIDGLTQARRVDEIEDMARSYIALTEDLQSSDVEVVVTSVKVGEVDALKVAEHVKQLRGAANEADAQASAAAREAVSALAGMDTPLRDIGALLGVSHQRVGQLVNGN